MSKQFNYIESKLTNKDQFFSPSDKVWIGIEDNLWPKKKSYLLIYFLLGLIISASLILYTLTIDKKENIQDSIIPKSTTESHIRKDANIDPNSFEYSQEQLIKKSDRQSHNPAFASNNSSSTINFELNNNPNLNKGLLKFTQVDSIITSSPSIPTKLKPNQYQNGGIIDKIINRNSGVKSVQLYRSKLITNHKKVEIEGPLIFKNKRTRNLNKYLFTGISKDFQLRSTSFDSRELSETIDYSNFINNFSISTGYGIQISRKLTIFMGLGYESSISKTRYNLAIPYDLSSEHHNSETASYENTFNHSLPNISGNLRSTLTLNRSDQSDVAHNEIVNIDLTTKIIDQSVAIPISLLYHLGKNSEGIYTGLTINPRYSIAQKLRILELEGHHNEVKFLTGNLKPTPLHILSVGINLELGYSLPIQSSYFADISANILKDFGSRSNSTFAGVNLKFRRRLY